MFGQRGGNIDWRRPRHFLGRKMDDDAYWLILGLCLHAFEEILLGTRCQAAFTERRWIDVVEQLR